MRTSPTLATCLLVATTAIADSDIKLPQASPAASAKLAIGTTEVKIDYHRPGVKGRTIWGDLVPFDTVWRLGANEATTISFGDAVKVAGHPVPAGTYALFAIPGRETWTIVLNRTHDQWGAYFYKEADDQLRFTVTPRPAEFMEWMAFALDPTGPSSAEVALTWDRLAVAFPVEVDVPTLVWADIMEELAEKDVDWEDYFYAAKYSLDQGGHAYEALAWADRAMALKPNFWTFEMKARHLHRAGRTAEALPLLDEAMADAMGKAPKEYVDGLAKLKTGWEAAATPR